MNQERLEYRIGGETGILYYSPAAFTPQKVPWYSFMLETLSIPGHSAAGRIMSMKNTNDTIGNRPCDFTAFSAVLQPNAPTRDSNIVTSFILFWTEKVIYEIQKFYK